MTGDAIGAKIAEGRTAEVFIYGEGKVVKLYRARFPKTLAERDYALSVAISSLFPGAPAVHGKVEVDGRAGIVFERLSGKTLVQEMTVRPWKAQWAADICAEVHLDILSRSADGLPSQKESIEGSIGRAGQLDAEEKRKIISYLHTLPDGGALCHGDFHPDNVFLSQRGPVVIDWMTATRGCPAGDLARSIMIAEAPGLPPGLPMVLLPFVGIVKRSFAARYRRRVLARCGIPESDMEAWLLPLRAARLVEGNSPEETAHHLALIRKRLAET